MRSVLDTRLVVVTGKGGAGKTTVAAALGLLAAGQGKRTVICEVADQERLAGLFGLDDLTAAERQLAPNLFGVSIDPEQAKREWLGYQLGSNTLAKLLGDSRVFQYLSAAAPGLDELVTIGKIWDLAQLERRTDGASYDMAIVDAPSTGHGLALLGAPRTYAEVARVGPVRRHAENIDQFLSGSETAVVAIARPEEIPVSETLELEHRLRDELEQELTVVVVNALHPRRFTAKEAVCLKAISDQGSEAVQMALAEHHRARHQDAQLRRLRRNIDAPVVTIPFLFESDLGITELEYLARRLERRLSKALEAKP